MGLLSGIYDRNGGSTKIAQADGADTAGRRRKGLFSIQPDQPKDMQGPRVVTVDVQAIVQGAWEQPAVAEPYGRAWVELQWGTGKVQHEVWIDAVPGQSVTLAASSLSAKAVLTGTPAEPVQFRMAVAYGGRGGGQAYWTAQPELIAAATPGTIFPVPPYADAVTIMQDTPSTAGANIALLDLAATSFTAIQRLEQSNLLPVVEQPITGGARFFRLTSGAVAGRIYVTRWRIAL